jgi:hypothetical protein
VFAATKHTKAEVDFESPAKGMDQCRDCEHYIYGTRGCELVKGTIQPGDWCRLFERIERVAKRV